MASDPGFELQKSIYGALTGDTTLMALITGVYDFVPDGTSFPYVQIGEDAFEEDGSHTFDGMGVTVTIHSWSQAAGRKQVKEIMAEVYRILHDSTLNISGHTMIMSRFEFGETLKDPDGKTHHGVQRFRMVTRGN